MVGGRSLLPWCQNMPYNAPVFFMPRCFKYVPSFSEELLL